MYIVIIQKLHTQQQMVFLANLTFYSICVIVYLKVAMAARGSGIHDMWRFLANHRHSYNYEV
jgi:H+/Cl- antiporter ClcA